MPGRTQSVVFEELITAIDVAGKLQGDDMEQNANPQTFAPGWAHGVEKVAVLALSNGDQLGAAIAIAIISGEAFPDGPHELVMGGHAGENADLANEAQPATVLKKLGIRVKPGGEYRVEFQVQGDTQDEFGCSAEIIFQDDEVEQPTFWISSAVTTATVDVEARGTNSSQTAQSIGARGSRMIVGAIGCAVGDMAALGVNHLVWKGSVALEDAQSILLGGVGGELIIGSGASNPPTQRTDLAIHVKEKTSVYSEFMSIIEAGVMDGAISLGFAVA